MIACSVAHTQVGDTIEEMKVLDGLQYLVQPKNTA